MFINININKKILPKEFITGRKCLVNIVPYSIVKILWYIKKIKVK